MHFVAHTSEERHSKSSQLPLNSSTKNLKLPKRVKNYKRDQQRNKNKPTFKYDYHIIIHRVAATFLCSGEQCGCFFYSRTNKQISAKMIQPTTPGCCVAIINHAKSTIPVVMEVTQGLWRATARTAVLLLFQLLQLCIANSLQFFNYLHNKKPAFSF